MYMKRTVDCGTYVEVKTYHAPGAREKGTPRRKREKPSRPAQKKLNRENAVERVAWKMRCNFVGGVHSHVTLTYDDGKNRSCSFDEMEADMKKFNDTFRRRYRKKFGKEYRYIFAYGVGAGGFRHVHILPNVTGEDENELFERTWRECIEGAGRVYFTRLDRPGDPGEDLSKLAEYFIQNGESALKFFGEEGRATYHASRNLKEPVITVEKVTRASTFKKKTTDRKNYTLVPGSEKSGRDMYGYEYFKYILRKRNIGGKFKC